MSPERVRRTLRRMAYQIVERNQGSESLELFGILQKGAPLARELGRLISEIEEQPCPVHALDVTAYRDDRAGEEPAAPAEPIEVADRNVILVDDVLFTGRTVRAALGAVVAHGRPRSIQLGVLIDRGHREYPIQPDFTGRSLPTKHRERVVVEEEDGEFTVYVAEG